MNNIKNNSTNLSKIIGSIKGENPQLNIFPKNEIEGSLNEMVALSNSQQFNLKSVCYIDSDIHEILTRLKKKKKLKIGSFLSFLAANYIKENQQEIKKVLSNNNQYLQKS